MFVGLGLCSSVAGGLGGCEDPCGLMAFVGDLFVDFFVLEVEGLNEIEEEAD